MKCLRVVIIIHGFQLPDLYGALETDLMAVITILENIYFRGESAFKLQRGMSLFFLVAILAGGEIRNIFLG